MTTKSDGGDVSRKRKLLEKQRAGKKKMRQCGTLEIPQEAFIAAVKMDGYQAVSAATNSNTFRAHFLGLVRETVAKADSLARQAMLASGLLREAFVADLLKKVLSPEVGRDR